MNRRFFRQSFRHEWGVIFGAWGLFLALLIVRSMLDADRSEPVFQSGQAMAWFFEYFAWALVTPVVFWLCLHLGRNGRWKPWQRVAAHFVAGLTVIVLMDVYTDLLRQYVFELRNPVDTIMASLKNSMDDVLSLRVLWEFMLYVTILSIGFARAYYMRLQDRRLQATELRADLTEARLQALRMQINPHFLFNTLNAVAGLVERDPKGVRTMVARLSALLRHTLDSSGRDEVTLSREMDVLSDYLAIMHVRFSDRLRVKTDIDDDVRAALVPDLILQPLVENAIKHGISRRETPGEVRISARRTGPYLRLTVEDDGDGSGDTLMGDGIPDTSSGIGLKNVRERLERLYGEDHRISLRPTTAGGLAAQIWLPFHEEPVEVPETGERIFDSLPSD
ncbi:histidine kinase [Longibacter salinarum]|uniref:Histidine kinase n=1 Tax=Longibacter salinarum TaxID=1850348 RepID=A0A2A8CYV0_9BACT|nr:histidine kinase [Longibacter salinarum]PEN13773.1 histidine kinase [Longibacter salinarum]